VKGTYSLLHFGTCGTTREIVAESDDRGVLTYAGRGYELTWMRTEMPVIFRREGGTRVYTRDRHVIYHRPLFRPSGVHFFAEFWSRSCAIELLASLGKPTDRYRRSKLAHSFFATEAEIEKEGT
jgi:hypothetical protein